MGSEVNLLLDGVHVGVLEESDLIASFVAGPGILNEDIFNQTTSRFGINIIGSSADSPSLIYLAGSMSEKLAVFFNKAVNIEKTVLSLFASGGTASVIIKERPIILLSGFLAAEDSYEFSDLRLSAG